GRVTLDRILIQRNQHVQSVAVRIHFLFADSHAQPDMAAANHRLITVVRVHVEPKPRHGLCERVSGFVQPVARGASDSDSDFTHGKISDLEWRGPKSALMSSRLWISSLRTEYFAGGILSPCQ